MDIVHIASEMAPIAKVGGLGDVIYGLSKSLVKKGHRVQVFLPKYDCIDYELVQDLKILHKELLVEEGKHQIANTLWSSTLEGLELIFVEPNHPGAYFERGCIYGQQDDNDRFLFFCKVCATFLAQDSPKIVHLHDWPAAGAVLFLQSPLKTIFTIHNLQHQGRCAVFNLERLGIEIEDEKLRDHENGDDLNLMRGALAKSDVITTVSPTYRDEILTSEYGCGLEKDLFLYKKKLKGILNGIDTEYWNPETDRFLSETFTMETYPEGKRSNKVFVQRHLSLPPSPEKPLVTAITRLTSQKGPDLIYYGIEKTLEIGGQFALLGSPPDEEMRDLFIEWNAHHDVAIRLDFDEALSHQLYAGADMLLMPSIFEPCGLAQMIAMRYGTVPLVRSTGGLKDTVKDEENGFSFDIPDNKGVASVLERAFETYRTENWDPLVKRAGACDFSWDVSAEKYIEIYED